MVFEPGQSPLRGRYVYISLGSSESLALVEVQVWSNDDNDEEDNDAAPMVSSCDDESYLLIRPNIEHYMLDGFSSLCKVINIMSWLLQSLQSHYRLQTHALHGSAPIPEAKFVHFKKLKEKKKIKVLAANSLATLVEGNNICIRCNGSFKPLVSHHTWCSKCLHSFCTSAEHHVLVGGVLSSSSLFESICDNNWGERSGNIRKLASHQSDNVQDQL